MKTYMAPKFLVKLDPECYIQCQVCVNQCGFDTHYYDAEDTGVRNREENCVGCHCCVLFCPTQALTISRNPLDYRENYNWRPEVIEDIIRQAETGEMLLTGKYAWGICTTDLRLTKRVNPDIGARRLANLLRGWSIELKDILGGLGVNTLESLRGNRLHLRGVGLTDTELEILGIRMAGS